MAAPVSGRIHPARPGIAAAGIFMSARGRLCMTWLYLPPRALTPAARRVCSAYRSAQAPAASTSDLRWPSPDTVLWVTSSGTPSPRPSSWRGWKTRPWIRRLSGTTLPASTAGRGAARWISSLRVIRASRSASQDGAGERTIRATSGRTSRGSSQNADLFGYSSRTSPIISTSVIARSGASWKAWATALRKDCLSIGFQYCPPIWSAPQYCPPI